MGRLRRRVEYQAVYTQGVKAMGRHLALFALARAEGGCRLGITATRRIGGAVVRNRARRRLRELVRRHSGTLEGWSGDLVVNVRRGCALAPWEELESELLRCLGRARRALAERGW